MFKTLGIEYQALDLDSVAFQEGDMGGKVRAVLLDRIGSPTIPQIFVGGELIGGATETFDAFNDGSLKTKLDAAGGSLNDKFKGNAYSFLPKWLQPHAA